MGAANCCKRPDEIVIDEVKYASTDNNKMAVVDQESIPQDTEQVHKSNANAEEEYAQGQTVSNQNLYEQEMGSPKIGGVYEVPISVSNPQQNYEEGYEQHNMGSLRQYENQNMQQNVETGNENQYEQEEEQAGYQYDEENENENINQNLNKRMSGEGNDNDGENQEDYNTLVNKMGNEANLKALRMGNLGLNKVSASSSENYNIQQSQKMNYNNLQNNIENSGGINLNAIGLTQQGGVNLKNISMGSQQTGKILPQSVRQFGYNIISKSQQQTASNNTNNQMDNMNNFGVEQKDITNSQSQQSENEDLNKYFQQATSHLVSVNSQQMMNENLDNNSRAKTGPVDSKQFAFNANPQAQGGLDINQIMPQRNINTHISQKSESVASVTPISTNEDISKYFKKQSNKVSMQQTNPPNDLNDDSVQAKVTKLNIDMENLPGAFGSSNINNFKQTTSTTTVIKKGESPDFKDFKFDMKNFNLDMKDLPETFGSSDINKTTKTVTTKTIEKEGDQVKETTTTTKTTGNIDLSDFKFDMKKFNLDTNDLPETFGSSNINNYKQTTTTTTTLEKEGNPDLKNFKFDMKNFNLDMKDLPETFGSSDINKTTKTVTTKTIEKEGDQVKETTTTTKTTGNIDLSNFKFDMKKFNLDTNDLPETFGSSNINNYKQTTTTTTTIEKEGNPDLKNFKFDMKNFNLDMKDLPETFGSSDINKNTKTVTTKTIEKEGDQVKETTTTTKTTGNIDLSNFKFDIKKFNLDTNDLPETFGSSDINKTTKTVTTKTIEKEGDNVKETTTTTKTTGNVDLGDFKFDMKNFNLDMKDLPETFGSSDINKTTKTVTTKTIEKEGDNVKETTTTTKTTGNIDLSDFKFDMKKFNLDTNDLPETFGSSDINKNVKQTTTTTTTTVKKEGNNDNPNLNNLKETTTTTTTKTMGNADLGDFKFDMKNFNIDMKDLPETFGSSDINKNVKQTTTTTTTTIKKEGNIEPQSFNIDMKNYKMDMDDLPEVFGSFNINQNLKGVTTTTKTVKKEGKDIDIKDLPEGLNPSDINNFKQITTTTTTEGKLDNKEFKESFGPSDNNFKQTTTTTKTEGKMGPNDLTNFQETKTTTTTMKNEGNFDMKDFKFDYNKFNFDMKDLPSAFGSSDISNYKQVTTTTKTTTTGNAPMGLNKLGLEHNLSSMPEISKYSNKLQETTTTTTTKITGNGPIDLKGFGIAQNSSTNINENEDLNKYFQQTSQTTSQPINLGQFSFQGIPSTSDMKQTTTTTVTKTTGNSPIDLKEFGFERNQNGNVDFKQLGNEGNSPIIGNEDYTKYFQETKTTTTKTNEPIDLKGFGMNMNSASNGGINLNSLGFDGSSQQQNTTTTVTKTTKIENSGGDIDLNNFGKNSGQFAAIHESFGNTHNSSNEYNTYGTSKTTVSKTTQSFAGPTQSYSYNYSFNMPATSSATVTKTTYSEVGP